MTVDGSGGLFDGLDDPTPPAFGGDLLPGVMQRGQHLRHQRRMAYAVGSAGVAVLVAGAAIGVVATGDSGSGKVITPTTQSPSPHHTKKPHHHHNNSPGSVTGGQQGGGHGSGGQHTPAACVTPTPTSTDTAPPPSPTPTDTTVPSPALTYTPSPDTESTASPSPTPIEDVCPSPTPSDPTATGSPSPTYPLPPLIAGFGQPFIGISGGIW